MYNHCTFGAIHTLQNRLATCIYPCTYIVMPRCACASEVYGSVFVCVYRLLQLLKDQRSASKGFYRLLVMFSWILIRGFAK